MDYGDDAFKAQAYALIEGNIPKIINERMRALTRENIEKIKNGERDMFV